MHIDASNVDPNGSCESAAGSPVTEHFTVSIDGGGGPDLFRAALRRKFAALTERGCHCVILERTLVECHYVQAILTPVGARIEAVGAHYLEPEGFELTAEQIAALESTGWLEPLDPDDDLDGPAPNWWRELGGPGFLARSVDQLLVALIEIYGLDAREPVHIEIFPSDHQHFEWIPDPDHPSGGELEPYD